jgi:glycosyltransferase involved in cell wall biosynthesis
MSAPHVLHIPRWYPNRFDPQLGIFVRKHARVVATFTASTVLYAHPDPELEDFEILEERNGNLLQVIVYYPVSMNKFRNLKNYRKALELGMEMIEKEVGEPDLLHFHIHLRNILEGKRLRPKLPYVVTEHWSGFVDGRYRLYPPWKKVLIRRHLKAAQAVSVPSENMQRIIREILPEQQVLLTPNLIEKSMESATKEDKVFLSVGDLRDVHKNMSGLMRALKEADMPGWKLRIIGDGPDRAMLEDIRDELELQERVEFKGRMANPDVLREMKKACFFVLNSNYESFGMVPAEAIMAGVPSIATISGGPEEYIDERNGILIPIGGHTELVQALEHMRDHWQDYPADKLMESMVHKYGDEAVKASFVDLYHRIDY